MTLIFKIHGYDFADRLLEDCFFDVEVEEVNGIFSVKAVKPASDCANYVRKIKWSIYKDAMGAEVLSRLNHLVEYLASEGITLDEELALFEEEDGRDRSWILTEV